MLGHFFDCENGDLRLSRNRSARMRARGLTKLTSGANIKVNRTQSWKIRKCESQMKKKTENRIRKALHFADNLIFYAVFLVLIALLVFGAYSIWDNHRIEDEGMAKQYDMYKPEPNDTKSFSELVKINPDVLGWLTVNGTGIDYPLVQGKDNDEYMNKTPDLKFALSGSIFLDSACSRDFSDFNTIIYGHHIEGDAMFGSIDRFRKKKFFDSHEKGSVFYGGSKYRIRIFAFLTVDAYDTGIYSFPKDEASKQRYLSYIRQRAEKYRDIGVDTGDRIIVMSTCMTDETNGRYILCAKIGGKLHSAEKNENDSMWWLIRRILKALLVLAVLAALIYLWYRYRKKQKMKKNLNGAAMAVAGTAAELKRKNKSKPGKDTAGSEDGRKPGKRRRSLGADAGAFLIRIGIIAAVIAAVFAFVFGIYTNSGTAMEPAIQDRDLTIYYRLDNAYLPNEAVVYENDGKVRTGRIIAKEGDTIEINSKGLKINGYYQQDPKGNGETLAVKDGTKYPLKLGKDQVFIMGDNREESEDSRMFGPVSLDDVKGSILTVIRRRDV